MPLQSAKIRAPKNEMCMAERNISERDLVPVDARFGRLRKADVDSPGPKVGLGRRITATAHRDPGWRQSFGRVIHWQLPQLSMTQRPISHTGEVNV